MSSRGAPPPPPSKKHPPEISPVVFEDESSTYPGLEAVGAPTPPELAATPPSSTSTSVPAKRMALKPAPPPPRPTSRLPQLPGGRQAPATSVAITQVAANSNAAEALDVSAASSAPPVSKRAATSTATTSAAPISAGLISTTPISAAPISTTVPATPSVSPDRTTLTEVTSKAPPASTPSQHPALDQRGRRMRLGEVLLKAGVVTEADVERALSVQKMGGGRLGGILVKLKLVTHEQIRQALAEQLGMEVVELENAELDETVLKVLPRELIKKYEAIPVRMEAGTLYIAMKDPYNFTAVDDIRFFTGLRVVVVACTEADYSRFVEDHLKTQGLIEEILEGGDFYDKAVSSVDSSPQATEAADDDESPEFVHDLRLAGEHPPIITLCNFLLVESIQRRASDIHIEPYETYFRVRIRVDGRLQTLITPPQRLHNPMISRLKIMAGMDIAKRRRPQDGHIAIVYRGETCHYRVSTLPTIYGEKCVIRLLKKEKALDDIDMLGFDPELLTTIKKMLKTPQGIVLVTGPTGSGKTTTLHAGLAYINDPETNIVTLEDPVEASLPGINHVQIHETTGVTFASGLRSILRQDPDVVFVGEMRDPEVSQIAVKAALTGHLVLSTLHTNSAAESLIRLEDMGIPPYLMANALLMIIAQRLLRKNCKLCAKPYTPLPEEIEEFRLTEAQLAEAQMRWGAGCDACYNTGYHGRQAVYEVLVFNNEIRSLVRRKAALEEVMAAAERAGMRVLFQGGIKQALRGETTLNEVRRTLSDAR